MKAFCLKRFIKAQMLFSGRTFGPGTRQKGIIDHIRRELIEIGEADFRGEPVLPEWIDVILLGLDGAWRSGASPGAIVKEMQRKLEVNSRREWMDWRMAPPDAAIEHIDLERERAARVASGAEFARVGSGAEFERPVGAEKDFDEFFDYDKAAEQGIVTPRDHPDYVPPTTDKIEYERAAFLGNRTTPPEPLKSLPAFPGWCWARYGVDIINNDNGVSKGDLVRWADRYGDEREAEVIRNQADQRARDRISPAPPMVDPEPEGDQTPEPEMDFGDGVDYMRPRGTGWMDPEPEPDLEDGSNYMRLFKSEWIDK